MINNLPFWDILSKINILDQNFYRIVEVLKIFDQIWKTYFSMNFKMNMIKITRKG